MTAPHAPDHHTIVVDADDPVALPPRLARRAARGRIPWGMLALEGFFTVVAILLALAADDWRERREERELAEHAVQAFAAEIAQNRERIAELVPYHVSLRDALDRALADSGGRVFRDPGEIFPEWRGIRPAFVTHAAWESAVATGALRHLPAEGLRALSMTYEYQARLDALNGVMYRLMIDPSMISAPDHRVPSRTIRAYLSDIVPMETELVRIYDQVLQGIERRTAP